MTGRNKTVTATAGDDAQTPGQVSSTGWKQILWRVKDEITTDHISVVAAGIAFYGLLSVFPAIAALISIAGLVMDPADIAAQLQTVVSMLPESAAGILQEQVDKVAGGDQTGTGIVAFIGVAIALYGAMKGVLTLIEGLNIAYDEQEQRGTIRLYLTAFLITLCLILGLIVGLGLVVLLPSLAALGHLPEPLATAVGWLKWPVMAVLVMLALAVIYRFGPSRAEPKWRWVSVGAVAASVLWILGTVAFSIYVRNFGSYTETYGALGGVIILLTWMWLSAFVVLAGAELNAETEQQTPRDTTTGAPRPMGTRDAVKADTPPGSRPSRGGETGKTRQPRHTGHGGKGATTARADLSMSMLLLGSAILKSVRKPRD
ncbi:YihY/virulence factor BrkB family protein [Paracoccus beibuensis]|uniref:YihY/virulence factor BrkB family protein n=1 Tax=Paracoccus beibuensis TaxID=547602 RepID=UPI00223ECCE3|nr:YihY/virulence factor BrkB family protein [Paracoccus beibuensis]